MTRRILVPVDNSSQSEKALEYAVEEYPDEHITVLHVIELDRASIYGDEGFLYGDEYLEQLRRRGTEELERASETAAEHGVDVTTELREGKPASTITGYIEDHDIDHVVIGSHGRSGPTRILLGSVAEAVTRRSPVPVTTVR
ncbi:universal stress protein [Natrinema salaciae]|uniref:Nucleotide-binding universal stress protein, UspA family n=1 Tax=Natrinema salaciae TaxID=1186196 RepID=A0A1H9P8I0_9EURY|nr:universal stress protein [Natrinema salaciae]SER44594.1 Nucleotide-binding universal stress protein, UspA family [Natrinema salaciae]